MDILKYKTLPAALTSYDLLKTLAIVLMFADHIGYFFFPGEMWFRVIGRFSAPVWFFLIGHARTRSIPKSYWVAGTLVWLSALVAGEYLFPVNIIATLILARLSIDWIMARALQSREALTGMFFLLLLTSVPSLIFFEYGTSVFLFSMAGYMVAHRTRFNIPFSVLAIFTLVSAVSYVLIQGAFMPSLSAAQLLALLAGMLILCGVFVIFKPVEFARSSLLIFRWPLQFFGRRTLETYAAHLIALRLLFMILKPEHFTFMNFRIFAFDHLVRMFL